MDPLIATTDQSSIGNNKSSKISSGPNTATKVLHKTDQDPSSAAVTVSPTSEASSDGLSSAKHNRLATENHRCSNNHRQTREQRDIRSHGDFQKPHDNDEYDDNKDVVVVAELNKDTDKSLNSSIAKQMGSLSIEGAGKETEGTPSNSSQTAPHSTASDRSKTTSTTNTTITTTSTPASCTDIVAQSRDLPEACHHQPTSRSSSSSVSVSCRNALASNVNHEPSETSSAMQQRRQPPIIKAQSLDFSCDDDSNVQIPSHFQTNHYLFQNNHHHSHRLLHNQHLHHHSHNSAHSPSPSASFSSPSASPALSSAQKERTLNKGCSLDTQRSEEDEEGSRGTGIAGTLTTEDVDADVDEDDDEESAIKRAPVQMTNSLRANSLGREVSPSQTQQRPRGSFDSISSTGETTDSSQQTDVVRLSSPQPRQHSLAKGLLPKVQSLESRPIYPNVPYSPYASPYGSPRSNRRRTPLRESRRISIEQSGSFLQLNQYKLMDQIGQGSYGLVKLAYSEEDSTHYAMKILSKRRLLRKAGLMSRGPKKTTSPLDRVYREIAVLKKLDHPNVVKLIEVLDDPLEDSLYLVFELVKQGEVLSIPTDSPLTEERAWSVFRDAVQGLEYLHYQRIIHADIKPGNLLLTECGHVKIADLGVCNEFLGEDATMNNGSTAGTPAFRAPETLFPGQHLYSGKAADIWALGATLYSLVYGNVPFVASSVPLLYEKIKNEALMIPEKPALSEELVDLIRKMLTKDPAKRITLPQIKEHPWVTSNGAHVLPSEDDNCRLVQVSEEDINSVVKSIPKLDTLILIKTMLKNHSFLNPFSRGVSGRAPQRGGSRLERFTRAGRSNSAPGAYHSPIDRQLSADCILPALSEHAVVSNNEIVEDI